MVYLVSLSLALTKLLCSCKSMAIIISLEMLMASAFMMWLTNGIQYGQIYFYILYFCMTVSESVMGLSIIISMLSYTSAHASSPLLGKV